MKNKDLFILSLLTFFYFVSISLVGSIPALLLILSFLIPSYYIALGVRRNNAPVFVSLLIQGLIISFVNFEYSIIIFFLGVFSVIMTEMIKKEISYGRVIAAGAFTIFIFIFATLTLTGSMDLMNSTEYKESFLKEAGSLVDIQVGNISKDEIETAIKLLFETTMVLMPSILIAMSFILSGFNYYLSLSMLRKWMPEDKRFEERFSDFRLPSDFMLGVLLLIIFSQILRFANIAYYNQFFKNIVSISEVALMWLGVSFFSYLMNKRRVSVFIRVIILGTAMIIPLISIFLPIAGVLEFIFKFRDKDESNREVL